MPVSSVTFSRSRAQHPQQPEPRLVAEQPVERGRLTHINKSTFVDDMIGKRLFQPARPVRP